MPPMTTTAEAILAATQRRYSAIRTLPVTGMRVRYRSLTESEYSQFEAATLTARDERTYNDRLKDAKVRLIILATVEAESDALVFKASDAAFLKDVDARETRVLYTDAVEHVGTTNRDIEGLVKNSELTGGSESQESSPAPPVG